MLIAIFSILIFLFLLMMLRIHLMQRIIGNLINQVKDIQHNVFVLRDCRTDYIEDFVKMKRSYSTLLALIETMNQDIKDLHEDADTIHTQLNWVDDRFNSLEHFIVLLDIRTMDTENNDVFYLLGVGGDSAMRMHLKRFHNCKDEDEPTVQQLNIKK